MKNDEMRLKDLRLATELLVEAVGQENGARERVAKRYGIQKSVITNRVQRIEEFFGVDFFKGAQRRTPTKAGEKMAKFGPKLIDAFEHCAVMLRRASERDEAR